MKWVNLLSMTFILLGFGKVGFCEMFAKRGTLQTLLKITRLPTKLPT